MVMQSSQRLTYCEIQAPIDVQFWEELRSLKLSQWKLSEPVVDITGTLRTNVSDKSNAHLTSAVFFGRDSFHVMAKNVSEDTSYIKHRSYNVPGVLINYNVHSHFNDVDVKSALLWVLSVRLLAPLFLASRASTVAESEAWSTAPFTLFFMLTFVDAKLYRFYHREAFPVITSDSPILVRRSFIGFDENLPFAPGVLAAIHEQSDARSRVHPQQVCAPFLCAIDECDSTMPLTFADFNPSQYKELQATGKRVIICFNDFSSVPTSLCWPARSILSCLRLALPSLQSLNVYAARVGGPESSLYVECECDPLGAETTSSMISCIERVCSKSFPELSVTSSECFMPPLKVTGWRKKKAGVIDLSSFMDPSLRADNDSRFNLDLMRWRMLPSLQLQGLADCKALLLGTGTLGCNVARNLLMWGVRNITLVDRGHVSYSNLARQSLFSMDDAKDRRTKVEAAANTLRAIIPTVTVNAVPMTIHMPGHRIDPEKLEETAEEIQKLIDLIQGHDVVFLLTDSREARWLPTTVCAAHGIPVVNVALGFDTYVVMRHGILTSTSTSNAVESPDAPCTTEWASFACYFCSDVVAPTDSMTARTLDQQCTVTRPGVSSIASAIAVEVLAQVYQHPLKFRCPGWRGDTPGGTAGAAVGACSLGVIPQQIRGSVFSHNMSHLYGERSPYCTACSDGILARYKKDGVAFLLQCINNPLFIEEVCGVKSLKARWETELNDMEWDSDVEVAS